MTLSLYKIISNCGKTATSGAVCVYLLNKMSFRIDWERVGRSSTVDVVCKPQELKRYFWRYREYSQPVPFLRNTHFYKQLGSGLSP